MTRKAALVTGINLLVLLLLLALGELAARSIRLARSCLQAPCDWRVASALRVRTLETFQPDFIGLSRPDPLLGYVPREGFVGVITDPTEGWADAQVMIRSDGFRSNGRREPLYAPEVLVVGDSFVFGDQVSDHETWPACLEVKLQRGVDNGGVFGYGAAQALRRALLKLDERPYRHLILSLLVGADFDRDRLSYYSGHPRPAVVRAAAGLTWAPVPETLLPGSEFQPARFKMALSYLYERSEAVASLFDAVAPGALRWQWTTVEHPDAAATTDIIDWTLGQLSELPLDTKVVLQYLDSHPDSNVLAERAAILRSAAAHALPVIDTLPMLKQFDAKDVWRGHYTPFGNRRVCDYVFEQGFR